jgi:tryptophan-rich sensory protein
MTFKQYVQLFFCLTIPLIIGGVSGFATSGGLQDWYPSLAKPSFNPPNFLFGPVWTTLYLLMGVSLYMILQLPPSTARRNALIIFGVQIFLNFWWSIIFFSWHEMGWALVEIIAIWFSILAMIITFKQLKPIAGYLQIPYLMWVSFATLLNASLWWLNRI